MKETLQSGRALAHMTAQKLSAKKALKLAFTREGSALNGESDKPREERSEFGLDEHEDLKKKKQKRGGGVMRWRGRKRRFEKNEYRSKRKRKIKGR